ncbi:MAG TPA: 2-hydroxychromene-2-carboxylate isomerase [Bryobacteraceae bacterium]|jgi:2-hydroxychromene-2-carboxylate isomerase
MQHVEFWFDFASTYSYPAALQIEKIAQSSNVPIIWRPFLLGPIFKAQGWNDSPFNIYPAKGHYMWRDLERLCESLAIPFRKPSVFPRNSVLVARLACFFSEEPWLPEFVRQIFMANFARDRNISDSAVVASVLETVGQPPSLITFAQSNEAREKLRDATAHATTMGIFGAPSFLVAGAELFWGNERLETAMAWACSHE